MPTTANKPISLKLHKRIILTFILATVLAILLVGSTLRYALEKTTMDNWKKRQEFETLEFAPQCDFEIQEAKRELELLSKMPQFQELPYADQVNLSIKGIPENVDLEKRNILRELLALQERFNTVVILEPNGDLYLAQPYKNQLKATRTNFSDRSYLKKSFQTKKPVISDSFIGASKVPIVVIVVPVIDKAGVIKAYIDGVFYLTSLSRLVSKGWIGNFDAGFIVDRKGHLIAHTDTKLIKKKYRKQYIEHPLVSRFLYKGQNDASKVMIEDCVDPVDGKRYLTSFVKLQSGWGLGLALNRATVLSEIRPTVWRITILVSFIILLVGTIGAFLAQWIARRWVTTEETLMKQTDDLGKRVKELNGIFDISKLLEKSDLSSEEIFQGIVEIIPPSYQYPEITCSRLVMKDKEYKTENFKETRWKQSSEIFVSGNRMGVLEVFYLEERAEIYEGPFLKEERRLIDEITDRLRTIIERGLVGAALEKSKNRFREMFEQSPFGIALIGSLTGHIYELNPKFAEISGRTVGEMKGIDWMSITHLGDEQEYLDNMALLNAGKINGFNMDKRYIRQDGSHVCINMTIAPVAVEDRTHPRHLCMIEDVTAQKEAMEERKQLQDKLQRAQKMEAIGTLAGGIAHDFNNLLMTIMMNTEFALRKIDNNGPLHEGLELSLAAGNRAKELVEQILTFSRQSDQEQQLFRITPIVKESLKMLRSSIPSTIEIHEHIEAKRDLVRATPSHINQVLFNLCSNAAHAMRESYGTIYVSLTNTGFAIDTDPVYKNTAPMSYLKLTVKDSGHGMSSEIMDKIFDPFFTTKKPGEGTGMGLAVVHGIMISVGGEIRVKSELGKGSVFDVLIPCIEKGRESETSFLQDPLKGKGRILVIDDEKMIVDTLMNVLENLGYQVTGKTNSIEALEIFRERPEQFALVITDQTMPRMSGVDLAKEMISIRSDVPIILCTGFSEAVGKEEALSLGIRNFLMKPVITNELAAIIYKILGGS